MTDEEIRIKVTELLGWYIADAKNGLGVAHGQAIWPHTVKPLPNYPQDLNACHEMVETLRKEDDSKWYDFRKHLMDECGSVMNAIQATARQRCEAFIKTMETK